MKINILFLSAALGCILFFFVPASAGDLDDGISLDESINTYDEISRPEINEKYIVRKAKAEMKRRDSQQDDGENSRRNRVITDNNFGGVYVAPGSKVQEIININEVDGSVTILETE